MKIIRRLKFSYGIDSGKVEEITYPNATKIRARLSLQLPNAYVVTKNQRLIKELLDKHHIASCSAQKRYRNHGIANNAMLHTLLIRTT